MLIFDTKAFRRLSVKKNIWVRELLSSCAATKTLPEGVSASSAKGIGICYTRTGRRFFDSVELETQFLGRIGEATERSGLWETLKSDWLCLDAELMPWSAKAQELLRRQYAAVGASSSGAFQAALTGLKTGRVSGRQDR